MTWTSGCAANAAHPSSGAMSMSGSTSEMQKSEAALMISTAIFGGAVVWFITEPSVTVGAVVLCAMLGYSAVAVWAALADRLRCTKRGRVNVLVFRN